LYLEEGILAGCHNEAEEEHPEIFEESFVKKQCTKASNSQG
jgi:hypothetical protein